MIISIPEYDWGYEATLIILRSWFFVLTILQALMSPNLNLRNWNYFAPSNSLYKIKNSSGY
jgi:hypothetical protein